MKHLKWLYCCVLSLVAVSVSAEKWLIKDMDFVRNDTTFRVVCNYNSKYQLVSRSVVYLDEGMPENYALTEQAFSSYGRTLQADYLWQNGQKIKFAKTEWEYNSDGLLSSETRYDGVSNNWQVCEQTLFFYQGTTLCTEQRHLRFDGSRWQPESRIIFEYNNEQLAMLSFDVAENEVWKPYGVLVFNYEDHLKSVVYKEVVEDEMTEKNRTLYIYTPSSELKYEKQQKWNGFNWQDDCKLVFGASEQGKTTIMSDWNVQYWSRMFKTSETYNNRFMTRQNGYFYGYNMWLPSYTTNVSVDETNRKRSISTAYDFFGDDESDVRQDFLQVQDNEAIFQYCSNALVTYIRVDETSVDQLYENEQQITVFPNSSPDGFYYIESSSIENIHWRVYTMQGFLMASDNGSDSRLIDLTHCPKGIYVANISIGLQKYAIKLIKIN